MVSARLALVWLATCGSTPPLAPSAVPAPTMVISVLRAECRAECPHYVIELWSDGTVKWTGLENVATFGVATSSVPTNELGDIVGMFDAAGFFRPTMPQVQISCSGGKCYDALCGGNDDPPANVTIVRAGTTYHGAIGACMSGLDRAVRRIDELALARNWTLATRPKSSPTPL